MKNILGLLENNAERKLRGSIRTTAAAKIAIRQDHLTDHQRAALELRLQHPGATIAELAQIGGLTKDQYWSRLRHALRKANRKPCSKCNQIFDFKYDYCPHCRPRIVW